MYGRGASHTLGGTHSDKDIQMEKFAVQISIGDALQILDDSPLHSGTPTRITLPQITNRIPVAHLAIERGLKFLIQENGREFKPHHNVHTHVRLLRELDAVAVTFLEKTFDDTTAFYGLNPNHPDLGHLRSLDAYLATVGTADAFEKMRYWEFDPDQDEPLFGKIWPTIHREILLAVIQLLSSNHSESETIAGRVERTVHNALFPTVELRYSPGSDRETSVRRYIDWLLGHTSRQAAIADAFRQDFNIGDDFMNEIVSQAHRSLAQSRDPAIRYLMTNIDVLPTQPRHVIPPIEWVGQRKEQAGKVVTPGGESLGFVQRTPDGVWHIIPLREGAVGISARARTQTDARSYLAQLRSQSYPFTINGTPRPIRLVGEAPYRFMRNARRMRESGDDSSAVPWTHKLTCWDQEHGIAVGDQIKAEMPYNDESRVVHAIEGVVTLVDGAEILVEGVDSVDVATISALQDSRFEP